MSLISGRRGARPRAGERRRPGRSRTAVASPHAPGARSPQDLAALRDQPPFPASAMDGYAVRARRCRRRSGDVCASSARAPPGSVSRRARQPARRCASSPARRCPRAPTPSSSRRTPRPRRRRVRSRRPPARAATSARPALDFTAGDVLLRGRPARSMRARLALAAAMGHGTLPVRRRPRVAILATGDELVRPGETARPRPDRRLEPLCRRRAGRDGRRRSRSISASPATRFDALEERIVAASDAQGATSS